jgi:SSS family solute:Na+ symporter
MLGNPFGVDNMYIAAVSPLLIMAVERLFSWTPVTSAAAEQITADEPQRTAAP